MAEKAEYKYLDVLRNCSPTNADVQQAGISNIRLYLKKWFNTITHSFCWECQRNTTQGLLDSCESDESNDVYHVMVSGSVNITHQKKRETWSK